MDQLTIFQALASELETEAEILSKRVDRDIEVSNCLETLINTNFNIYIYGERGVGKTFLIKTIHRELIKKDSTIFPFYVSVFLLTRMDENTNEGEFATLMALQLVCAIWEGIYNNPVSYLIDYPDDIESKIDTSRKYSLERQEYILNLYQQLSVSIRKRAHHSGNSIGISSIVKGNSEEKSDFETERGKLASVEVLNIIKELTIFLKLTENKRKLVVLCDEANKMDFKWQKEIISKHLDIFTDFNFQFVFVAGYLMKFEDVIIPDCFDYILHIKGLSPRYTKELILKYFTYCTIAIDDPCINYLVTHTSGNPRTIISVIHSIILKSNREEIVSISKKLLEKEINRIKAYHPPYRQP